MSQMRDLYRAYYPLTESDRKNAWSKGLVVLDTSALLNLYRYPLAARERLMVVLEGLKNRLWLPHYVGLEFHRNRPKIRYEQIGGFQKVREEVRFLKAEFKKRIDKLQLEKRHALIDAEPLLAAVNEATGKFLTALNITEQKQDSLYQEDALQRQIEELFEGKIGEEPTQERLEKIYKEGAVRYKHQIPPGYLDLQKSSSAKEPGEFSFGGLTFQRCYGDLVIWKQILKKAKEADIDSLVLITDDVKKDWWQFVGKRRIGPRPELIDEAMREGGISTLVMQTSERFAEYAAIELGIEVGEDIIEQISVSKKVEAATSTLEEEPGFLEKILDTEEGVGEMTQVAEGLTLDFQRIQGIATEGAKRLGSTRDTRMRTKITNETASQLGDASVEFATKVDALKAGLLKIEPGVDVIMSRIDAVRAEGGDVPEVRETLIGMFTSIVESAQNVQNFDSTLGGVPDATAALRISIRELRSEMQRYIEIGKRAQVWLDRWQ